MNNREYSDIEKYNALHIILEPKYDGHLPKNHNEGGQANGIFDKSWIVFRSFDYNYNNPINGDFFKSIEQSTGHLLHETGHSLGLFHSFESQCDDDCLDNGCPPDKTSNNYMDYTPWLNTRSFSECQISRIHFGLMGLSGNISDILVDDYCNNLIGPIIRIRDTISIGGKRYMNQNILIRNGLLNITCEVSMTAKSKIEIDKMGILNLENGVLHNKCNFSWKGVIVKKEGSMILNSNNIAGYTIQVKSGGTLIVKNEVVLRDAKIVLERGAYLSMGKNGKITTIGNKNGFIQKNGVIEGINPNIAIKENYDKNPIEIVPN